MRNAGELQTMNSESSIVQYLLGELSEEEKVQFEERYFSDDRVFEELLAVETELIDSFVKGELPETRRERFQSFYLNSPERRERVQIAKCLMEGIIEEQALSQPFVRVDAKAGSFWRSLVDWCTASSPIARMAYVSAAVAVLVFGAVMLIENRHLRYDLSRMQADESTLGKRNQELQQQVINLNAAVVGKGPLDSGTEIAQLHPPERFSVSISLLPLSRHAEGAAGNRLILPPAARSVVLNLSFESDEHLGYSAVIETAEGNEIGEIDKLVTHGTKDGEKSVSVRVPAKLLKNNTYVVTLTGRTAAGDREDVASYSFQVVKR
jgi:hypothetical protein